MPAIDLAEWPDGKLLMLVPWNVPPNISSNAERERNSTSEGEGKGCMHAALTTVVEIRAVADETVVLAVRDTKNPT